MRPILISPLIQFSAVLDCGHVEPAHFGARARAGEGEAECAEARYVSAYCAEPRVPRRWGCTTHARRWADGDDGARARPLLKPSVESLLRDRGSARLAVEVLVGFRERVRGLVE